MVVREPIGVVGIITPWNFPLLIASQKIPFALAAGCSVVIKASDFTPATTTRLVQLLHECGLPDGVANIVHGAGDVGAYLASHPGTDMTSFTGSTGVGRSIMAAAATTLKHVSLELGGKNPQVILADADLDAAVASASWAAHFNQGECCNAGSRLLVQSDVADEVVERVAQLSNQVKVGDPLAEDTEVGSDHQRRPPGDDHPVRARRRSRRRRGRSPEGAVSIARPGGSSRPPSSTTSDPQPAGHR